MAHLAKARLPPQVGREKSKGKGPLEVGNGFIQSMNLFQSIIVFKSHEALQLIISGRC